MSTIDYSKQTTIVTGASSGIGVEFAREFAKRGSDVVLVARRLERLEKLAAELTSTYGVQATAIPLDLSLPGAGRTLAEEVEKRGLSVTSLVNNAGFGTFGPFHAEEPGRLREEINVNVASVVDISRAFIGRLRASGNGVLINVASTVAYQPIPNMAVYAATKAFVLGFTEALWQESLGTGLRVLLVSPGATRTEFNDVLGTEEAASGASFQTPQQVVETALQALDRRTPPPSVVSGRMNRLMSNAARLLSRRRAVLVAASMTKTND